MAKFDWLRDAERRFDKRYPEPPWLVWAVVLGTGSTAIAWLTSRHLEPHGPMLATPFWFAVMLVQFAVGRTGGVTVTVLAGVLAVAEGGMPGPPGYSPYLWMVVHLAGWLLLVVAVPPRHTPLRWFARVWQASRRRLPHPYNGALTVDFARPAARR